MRRERRGELETLLQRIDDHLERDDAAGARRELTRARKAFPRSHELEECELLILLAEERPEDALELIERILSEEPPCLLALRERPSVLIDLGRFSEARLCLDALLKTTLIEEDDEAAELHHDRALCLDREGKPDEADADFQEAARLIPADFAVPLRLTASEFDQLAGEAVDSIPEELQSYLRQVAVVVRDYPPPGDDPFCLGLYIGVPRTDRTQTTNDHLDHVLIFKRNHELLGLGLDELRDEVRKTVLHEIAHHFGLGEEAMGEYA